MEASTASHTGEASRPPELVIVDDDSDTREILAEALESHGYRVRVAGNGADGLNLLDDHLPELVLLDVDMPVLSGPEVAAAMIERDRGCEQLPIVLLSGNVRLAATAAAVGTPYFLGKPYSLDSILRLVARALAERFAPTPETSP